MKPIKTTLLIGLLIINLPGFSQTKVGPDSIQAMLRGSKNIWRSNPDSAFKLATLCIKFAEDIKDNRAMADSYRAIGVLHYLAADYNAAIDYYLKASRHFTLANDSTQLASIYMNLGLVYKRTKDYTKATDNYHKAIGIYMSTNNKSMLASSYYNLGTYYGDGLNILDSAKHYYTLSLGTYRSIPDTINIYKPIGGLADIELRMGNTQKAISLAKEMYRIAISQNDYYSMPVYHYVLNQAYLKENKFELSLAHIDSALEICSSRGFKDSAIELMGFKKQTLQAMGNYPAALALSDSIHSEYKKIYNDDLNKKINATIIQHEKEKTAIKSELLQREFQMERNRWIFATLLLLVSLVASGFIFLAHKRKSIITRLKLSNMRMEKESLEREIELKNRELTSSAMHIIKNNSFLEEMKEKIAAIIDKPQPNVNKELSSLTYNIKKVTSASKDWEVFRMQFENVHPQFFDKLKAEYPDLTENDLRLCALIRLNLGTKECADFLAVEPNTIKVSRYRLRKKLKMDNDENLYDKISSINKSIIETGPIQ